MHFVLCALLPWYYVSKNIQENIQVFTYEWLGIPTESGIPRIIDRSVTSTTDPKTAIAHAKHLLKGTTTFLGKKPYAVRVFDNDSVLVWTGTADDA